MARGWESKSVESQVEDKLSARSAPKRVLSAEERTRAGERDSLLMARTCLERELALTTAPARRAALEDALAQLTAAIAKTNA